MNIENHVLTGLEKVTTWDLPDEQLADAITNQVRLLAKINPDDAFEEQPETH